ncbi:DNA-binding transcriptional regulator, MerR family [Aliiroseovarius halocynthiae]|uniref:MerR family transcriptional regulator n=1 Tax=Aliiroseovarius halocynthiae TaxID=985055 RepID=A0A545SLS5_9RHOB|nr:MerR family transcriptional regulator [Aliiroseovarius halocynthiae]TQV65929.1 MerR family transcriptional regulator [Aliiroseovarius halocynthiae]SMR83438.1 DNA-binding transcriptional regulator, MerR family [Aliiroseovarius halocynthiae]
MKIGEIAERVGVSTDTLRYYEKRGLIRSDRHTNGYRDFHKDVAERVRQIRLAQSLGFSLTEIEALLSTLDSTIPVDQLRQVLDEKLTEINQRISQLKQLRAAINLRLEQACPLNVPRG